MNATNNNKRPLLVQSLIIGVIAALVVAAALVLSRPSESEKPAAVTPVENANASLRVVAGGANASNTAFSRQDGLGPAADIYFASQIIRDGDKMLFSEYYPRDFDAGKDDKVDSAIIYPRGGAIRTLTSGGEVETVFLSKKLDGSKRPVMGIVKMGDKIIFSRGGAVWSMERKTGKLSVLAGSLNQAGFKDGTGSAARFSLPVSFALSSQTLYISDRGNNAIRALDLKSGQVTTVAELIYEPQSILISANKLWITGAGLNSLDLSCKANCSVKSYDLGPQMLSRAIAADPAGRLVVIGDQGFFRYDPESGKAAKIVLPEGQGVPRATGAVFFDGRLYITDGSGQIQSMKY